ncbi:cerebellin-1-like [Mercenaria mercenaria]|uniref:cerebellin-1-like n=1 Tax=Mercenaria mercenaria TaxID=6596 RepID=UPI00234EA517|nr:cerebellin-1-like [Mercenaria mercenaria]
MSIKTLVIVCGFLAISRALENISVSETTHKDQNDNGNVQEVSNNLEHFESNKKFQDLLARMEHLEAREKSREKTYLKQLNSLRRQLVIQARRTASLEGKVRRLSNKSPDSLKQELKKTDSKDTSNDSNGRLRHAPIESREEVQTQRIRRAENENPVAFFATLSQHLTHVGAHQPITFDNVVTNIGNAYNSHFGSFIAPVSGTYVFSATLFSHYHTNYHAQFVKNGQAITTMYVSGSEAGYDTTSQTIVLQLQKGDDVCVQNYDTDRPVYGYNYSTFAGFLLQEDMSSSAIVGR